MVVLWNKTSAWRMHARTLTHFLSASLSFFAWFSVWEITQNKWLMYFTARLRVESVPRFSLHFSRSALRFSFLPRFRRRLCFMNESAWRLARKDTAGARLLRRKLLSSLWTSGKSHFQLRFVFISRIAHSRALALVCLSFVVFNWQLLVLFWDSARHVDHSRLVLLFF